MSELPSGEDSAHHSGRIPTLDGLRAISICMVIISHQFTHNRALHVLGEMGVRIFFVISGYIITTLLLREDREHGSVSLKKFFFRRTLRIFPPCYAYVVAVFLLSLLGQINGIGASDFAAALTYTVNYKQDTHWLLAHLWSLGVEEQFYLVWPVLFVASRDRYRLAFLTLVIVLVPCLRVATFSGTLPSVSSHSFHLVADALASGCLISLLPASSSIHRFCRRLPTSIVAMIAIAMISCAIWAVLAGLPVSRGYAPTIANIAIAVFVLNSVVPSRTLVFRFLNSPWLTTVGLWSYSLYLWQQPFLFHPPAPRFYATFPLNFIFVFIGGLSSYYLIERPCQRIRRRLPS